MKSNGSDRGNSRSWVPPTVTKLAIGTQTKSPVEADPTLASGRGGAGTNSAVEPPPPQAPGTKFGFSLEWSFPLSVRTE